MKRKHYSLLLLLTVAQAVAGQNQWAWMNGEQSPNINGIYGIQGVAAPSNAPGSRSGACTWTDAEGNFWLFGGSGYGESSDNGFLNDLWKFSPTLNLWAWMGGSKNKNTPGIYGNKGVAFPGNQPGGRQNAVSWMDSQGNLWLFGGRGIAKEEDNDQEGLLNDLWMYSPLTQLWTWVSGDDKVDRKGEYGKRTESSQSNFPGSRYLATGWKDGNGNLWLFGGRGFSSKDDEASDLNDLWKYSPNANEWTWMKGDKSEKANAHYGDRGDFSEDNTPGGRRGSTGLTDNNGTFWLFGGGNDSDLLSDLWKYDRSNNQWAWISGSKRDNQEPRFKEKGVPDPDGNPGARMFASGWVGSGGNLWVFGGSGYGGNSGPNPLNNLWKYNSATDEWTFVKGEISINPTAVYGSKGVGATDNTPGGMSNSSAWKDQQGNLWVFGGRSLPGFLNQTWNFSLACGDLSGTITPATASICAGGSQVLIASGGTSYEWKRDGITIEGKTSAKLTVTEQGTYSVIIKNDDCTAPAANTAVVTLASDPTGTITPATATICEGSSQLLTATGGTYYEWRRNNVPIAGQTNPTYTATQPGTYSVIITNGSCSGPASNTAVITQVAPPSGTISPATASICKGGSQVLTATGGTSYEWQRDGVTLDDETEATLTVTTAGTYSVIIKNNNCSKPASNTAVVTLESEGGIRYADKMVKANVATPLAAREIGVIYEWTPVTGLDDPSSATPMVTVSSDIEYLVWITPAEGCAVTDTVRVTVVAVVVDTKVFVPTAFTPNGNNANDRLRPLGNIGAIYYFKVYNRWGNLVFQTSESGAGWDGQYKGVPQPSDTYTWILSGITPDGQSIKKTGKTLLIR